MSAAEIIQQITTSPGIFSFSAFLKIKQVSLPSYAFSDSKLEMSEAYPLLPLFAYGNVSDYNVEKYGLLGEQQLYKLKLLTLASIAASRG